MTTIRADLVGCCTLSGKTDFYPARFDELDRQAPEMARVLQTFAFPEGSVFLVISWVNEVVQFAPLEKAIQIAGHYGTNAEVSMFDAGRVASICRQFKPAGVFGVCKATLDGLAMFGHDPARVFDGSIVWARPDAYDALVAVGGIRVHRMAVLGPMLAFECAERRLHYRARDWSIEDGPTLRISSRMPQLTPLVGADTGVIGTTVAEPCPCGSRDGTIRLGKPE